MNDAQTAHAAVVEAAKKVVRAWAQHAYTIQTYGEGEAEVLRQIVQQEEEGLQTAVADLLAATEPRVIRSISAADFARISDEFAKTLLPYDAMICEIHAIRAERDALPKDAARLDWLESRKSYSISNLGGMACAHLWVTDGEDVRVTKSVTKPTIREAIDAAMEAKV
jgi:hypothetical protein